MTDNPTLHITTQGEHEVVITRTFDAPPDLVFDAMTKADLLARWVIPTGWTMEHCESDAVVGGAWRMVMRQPGGKQIGQRGVYLELTAGKRVVKTEQWEDWNPGETIVTSDLHPEGGKTRFVSVIRFPSQEVRDIILKSGLEHGARDIYHRLDEVLVSLRPEQLSKSR